MCYSRDCIASDQRKQEEAKRSQAAQEQRAGVVNTLMEDAKRQAEQAKPQAAPTKEAVPAK